MVNVFEMERAGIPFNNADSQEVVSGGDYEHHILRDKKSCNKVNAPARNRICSHCKQDTKKHGPCP